MRTIGIIVLSIGIILGIYALLMDTSVQAYDGSRVNNIGLMNTKQNLIIVAGVLSNFWAMILIFKKSKHDDDDDTTDIDIKPDEITEGSEPKKPAPVSKNPIEILDDLKNKGLITSSEYEEKHTKLVNQIEEDERINVLNSRINKKANPLIDLALDARNNGLISEQEYEAKKQEIIDKCSNEVKRQDVNINRDIYNKLSDLKKERFEECLETIGDLDLIVFHHNKVKVIDSQRWEEIIKEGTVNNYEIIYQNRLT
jgi:hypothetical protein